MITTSLQPILSCILAHRQNGILPVRQSATWRYSLSRTAVWKNVVPVDTLAVGEACISFFKSNEVVGGTIFSLIRHWRGKFFLCKSLRSTSVSLFDVSGPMFSQIKDTALISRIKDIGLICRIKDITVFSRIKLIAMLSRIKTISCSVEN